MGYREEIDAANKQGQSREARWALRAAIREKYGMGKEKRERGGVAGAYDRNKEYIKPVAQIAAGALGGPLAGGIVGGLMGGLDREGKGGIGFDVKQGIGGAAQGAALGSVGAWGRGAIQAQLAKRAAASAGGAAAQAVAGAGGAAPAAVAAPAAAAPAAAPASAVPSLASRVGKFIKDAPEAVGGAFTAGAQMMDSGNNRRIASQNAALGQQELAFLQKKYEDEQKEKQRRSQIAQQLYQAIQGQMSYNRPPGGM